MAKQTGSIDLKALKAAGDIQQHFWTGADGAHVTQIPQEDFVADPANGGGNTLITSGGMLVRNGETVSAEFGNNNITLNTPDGVPALKVESSANTRTQIITKSLNYLIGGRLEYLQTKGGFCQDIASADAGTQFTIVVRSKYYQAPTLTFTKGTNSSQTTRLSLGEDGWYDFRIDYNANIGEIYITYTDSIDHEESAPVSIYDVLITYEQTTFVPQTEIAGAVTWKDPTDVFVVTTEPFSYPAISNGSGSGTRTATFSKPGSGYYPLGVMGFRTGNSAAVVVRFGLSSRSIDSAELSYVLRAVGSVSAGSGDVDILWIRSE